MQQRDLVDSPAAPLVTVIMPVRNEETSLEQSVGSVLEQDYPPDRIELIVADGMSNDGTRDVLKRISSCDSRLRIIDNQALIFSTGFNAGLEIACGDIILMMGGHTLLCPNYLRTCSALLQQHVADCVGGVLDTSPQHSAAEAISLAMSSTFGVGGAAFRVGVPKPRYVDTLAFGAYSREIIGRVGKLDEELVRNQDDEFNYRLRKHGARILLVPEIWARYSSRASLSSLWRQYFQYGFWKVRVLQKHPRQMQMRHFVPGCFVSALGICLLGMPFSSNLSRSALLLAATYAVVNLSFSARASVRAHNPKILRDLPLVFAVLHFAYGSGFLLGLFRFAKGWKSTFHLRQSSTASPVHP